MKKVISVLLIIVLTLQSFLVPDVVHGKTLSDLKNELTAKQNELQENQKKKQLTQAEINAIQNEIVSTQNEIKQTYTDIANLDKEIEQLNKDIEIKDKEMKDIMNFLQVSNGESAYLEYTFGAKDFTDFIYRTAITEQMTKYNDNLIKEFNQKIEDSKKKQEEIAKKRETLAVKQEELSSKKSKLGQEYNELASTGVKVEDEIEYQKEIIALYKEKGCKDNEDISTCGRSTLPAGTAFFRPTTTGIVTSEWGQRYLVGDWHEGIDIGVPQGTPVYAVGNGMVATLFVRYPLGGNMVIIHHNINNQTYTSVYAHLSSINVSKGQTVNRNTIIGYSGGGASTMAPNNVCGLPGGTGWDKYTCGEHLHLTIARGLYGPDYDFNYMNYTASINPRSVINFPSYGRWTDRVTAY